jgi:hypothetical protein
MRFIFPKEEDVNWKIIESSEKVQNSLITPLPAGRQGL